MNILPEMPWWLYALVGTIGFYLVWHAWTRPLDQQRWFLPALLAIESADAFFKMIKHFPS